MHHSTGGGLIWDGSVRELLTDLGYEFWDHGYNEEGLVEHSGSALGINWEVPDDNTDPDGWYHIFSQPVTDPPSNTFSHMLEFDAILFKSCFPASDIASDEQFEEYRQYYLSIRDVIDQHPDKLFIPLTTPPLVPNATSPENAARAQRWAEYLTSDEYLQGHPNVRVFDLFYHLADENGTLQADYRVDEWDSHPNALANRTVGAILVDFVVRRFDFAPGQPVHSLFRQTMVSRRTIPAAMSVTIQRPLMRIARAATRSLTSRLVSPMIGGTGPSRPCCHGQSSSRDVTVTTPCN